MSTPERIKLDPPGQDRQVLVHSCCAPCVGEVLEAMLHSGVEPTVYFYNPNIHPRKEYELRKQENIRFCEKMAIPFIDADYDTRNWFERTRGLEWEPEKGVRCTRCFDMRFERTAAYAHAHGFRVFTSCLGISRWKDMDQINGCGIRSAARYPDLQYWTINWRKNGGANRMIEISKRERFYQQEYCGCVYSKRDTDAWRVKNGRKPVEIGVKYYGDDDSDAESGCGSPD
jgi:predicted adenine nucleotide alpha hydrolase (AANH) superfamily ATPase